MLLRQELRTNKSRTIKLLRQKVKRKDRQMKVLREQRGPTSVAAPAELERTRRELKNVKKRCTRLQSLVHQKMLLVKKDDTGLCDKLREQHAEIHYLEHHTLLLEESVTEQMEPQQVLDKPGQTFPVGMRLAVFDGLINQVPTQNIPHLIGKFAGRFGVSIASIPHRSTVEAMARELGVIADVQTAEALLNNKHVTLGFDATTQEGVHINAIHITTESACYVVAVDELPGGTAVDYSEHICQSIDHLATTYSNFTHTDLQTNRSNIINNISNCMMDRVAANHAAIVLVNETWHKTLNELNCHLHPLDTIASSSRSALRKLETEKGKLFGNDCFAANIVLQMNKMRYKDGKGDPRGFKSFLDSEKLPRGFIPRYRGNRLHVLFHICGKYHEKHDAMLRYLRCGTTACGGLRMALLQDFDTETARLELQVLGLFGKLLSGPWMRKFYTSGESDISHIQGIGIIKVVITVMKEEMADPARLLTSTSDFFGDALDPNTDTTLNALLKPPVDVERFSRMMKTVISATITVLERQYKVYFDLDVTEKLTLETRSARSHNMDAEEVMGMFSALQKKSPHATICFLSSKMRAQKNRTVDYLDREGTDRDALIQFATTRGRKLRQLRRVKQRDIQAELSARIATKLQEKETRDRKKVEKLLKTTSMEDVSEIYHLEPTKRNDLADILQGDIIGRNICHAWMDEGAKVIYNGRIEKFRQKTGIYRVGYWSQRETYADAVDYNMSMHELAADAIFDELVLC